MGTRVPKVRGFGRPNRLIQEMLIERAMREIADSDKKKRQQFGGADTMSAQTRCSIYLAQTGRGRLTPKQERRAAKKTWNHPVDASATSLPARAAA